MQLCWSHSGILPPFHWCKYTYTQTGKNGSATEVDYRACQTDSEGFYIEAAYTLDEKGKINYTSETAIFIDIGDAGGTIRSTGKTSCVLTVDNCLLEGNSSLQSGGGLYWNANDERNVLPQCSAVIKNSTVCDNYTVRDGGGICVVGKASTSDAAYGPAYFELSGSNMAIYGNEAAYSADDVFSNGLNTQLKVPLVSDMNLDGYDFKAEGWFEDYNNNDTQYHLGLNMANAPAGEHSAIRYRESLSSQRLHIVPVYVTGNDGDQTAGSRAYVNQQNAYVAMTLGIPAAVNDTVVIDYDLSVNINLYENDLLVTTDDFENTGKLGIARPSTITVNDDVYYSAALMGEFPAKVLNHGDNLLKFGKATLGDDGVLKYALTDKSITSEEVFYYVVRHNEYYYYASVTVIPATTIYYEDNCGFIIYDGEWEHTDGSDSGTDLGNYSQNQNRPGQSILEDLDADKIYGYDDSLNSMASYSMGSAHKVRVSEDKDATATFTFTGTGFDVISLCNNDTGMVARSRPPQL